MTAPKTKGIGRSYILIAKHVNYVGDDCILFPYSINAESGYGYLGWNGKLYRAHRLMCELAHGKPDHPKLEAAHSCHVPNCINPRHLSWKTHKQNIHDKVIRGTISEANRYGNKGKLNPTEVRLVRRLEGKKTQVEIGRIVGLSESAIRAIQKRRTYTHIQ